MDKGAGGDCACLQMDKSAGGDCVRISKWTKGAGGDCVPICKWTKSVGGACVRVSKWTNVPVVPVYVSPNTPRDDWKSLVFPN
jgi:hypothetical protein